MATPTKVFPTEGHYVAGVPHVIHEFPTKAAAEDFAAEHPQAFSLDRADVAPDAPADTRATLPKEVPAPDVAPIAGDAGEGA